MTRRPPPARRHFNPATPDRDVLLVTWLLRLAVAGIVAGTLGIVGPPLTAWAQGLAPEARTRAVPSPPTLTDGPSYVRRELPALRIPTAATTTTEQPPAPEPYVAPQPAPTTWEGVTATVATPPAVTSTPPAPTVEPAPEPPPEEPIEEPPPVDPEPDPEPEPEVPDEPPVETPVETPEIPAPTEIAPTTEETAP